MNVKCHDNGGLALLAGPYVHGRNVNLLLRKDLGYIGKHANPVIGKYLDFRGILLIVAGALRHLPFRVNHPAPFILRQVDDVHTVRAVNGNPAAPGDKSHNFIPWHRVAALGETDRQIMDPLDHDTAL